jgi:hypothetical protein
MKLSVAIGAASLALASVTAGAQDNWIPLTSSDLSDGAVLKGSFQIGKNKSGDAIAVVTGKESDKRTKQIALEKWYVRVLQCQQQQGKLVGLTMDGEYKWEADFIFGAGSVGAAKAQFICGLVDYQKNKGM